MTSRTHRTGLGAVLGFALASLCALPIAASADVDTREFKVVGTWGNLANWKEHESRLWNKVLPDASGGKLTANAKPYTELGLSGFEVMRLLKLGVYDAVHGLTSYTSQDSPALEGIDLAGVVQDLPTFRRAMEAYRPIIARELEDKYNAHLVMLYSFPSQQLWCNLGDKGLKDVGLDDLKGKKIRTYSTTLGDFIEGLDASAVTIAFAEVVPALQKGVADCGITGTGPAYNAKWWQVTTHNIQVRLGFAATFMAVNKSTWDGLSADTRKLVTEQGKKVEDEMWAAVQREDATALKCNASGPCPWGEPGGMVPIAPSAEDEAMLKSIVQDYVLKRWGERCGADCARQYNDTVGAVTGIEVPL